MMVRISLFFLLMISTATAQSTTPEVPYQNELERLAEILGSLHFLRRLCGEDGSAWREQMERILEAENPETFRRSRLIAKFNQGYRSFNSVYVQCTPAAMEAIDRYMIEGETITQGIVNRFGN